MEEAGKTATESIENIRTVASLTKEEKMVDNYRSLLIGPYYTSLKKAHLTALAFSFSTGILFFAYAAAFWFGAYLIKEGEMDYTDVFKWVGKERCSLLNKNIWCFSLYFYDQLLKLKLFFFR